MAIWHDRRSLRSSLRLVRFVLSNEMRAKSLNVVIHLFFRGERSCERVRIRDSTNSSLVIVPFADDVWLESYGSWIPAGICAKNKNYRINSA